MDELLNTANGKTEPASRSDVEAWFSAPQITVLAPASRNTYSPSGSDSSDRPQPERIQEILEAQEELQSCRNHVFQLESALSEQARDGQQLNKALRLRTAHISELELKLIKLRTELSERCVDSEQLRQKIDSIYSSLCWRVTRPIRWCHAKTDLAQGRLSRAPPIQKVPRALMLVCSCQSISMGLLLKPKS
jgi:hypothetical protein